MDKSILYIGSLEPTCNSFRRFKSLEAIGCKLSGIDIRPYIYETRFSPFHFHLNFGPGILKLNNKVMQVVRETKPDLLWVDNKPFLQARTLKCIRKECPEIKIINLITDDPTGRFKYAWSLCLKTASFYDMHFVQRHVNIGELKQCGARNVEICYRSYDPSFHRPVILDTPDEEKYKAAVGFIGTRERYREEFIVYLIKNGIPVSITGNDWQKAKRWDVIKPHYKGPSVYGEAYPKTISGFDIGLHFLRHANRDEQDSRTFEIPACGTFMLAERSEVHSSLYRENKEAVFFETKKELLEKVKYYLSHDEERKAIAKAGYERCVTSGYSHEARLKQVLKKIFS